MDKFAVSPTNEPPALDALDLMAVRLSIVRRLLRLAEEDRRLERLLPERSSKGHLLWLHPDGTRTP